MVQGTLVKGCSRAAWVGISLIYSAHGAHAFGAVLCFLPYWVLPGADGNVVGEVL